MTNEHLRGEVRGTRAELCHTIEGVLRSYSFVQRFVMDRQPPAFSMLIALVEADNHTVPASELRERAESATRRIATDVDSGVILQRNDSLRVYRRLLAEARRNGIDIDEHESAMLRVLRAELQIRLVEHYLIEHHVELSGFWDTNHAFLHELNAMRSVGLVFAHEGAIVMADDVAPMVRQALGIEMNRDDARRLYATLSSGQLSQALERLGLRTSGSKEERIERLIESWTPAREIADGIDLADLREIARALQLKTSGAKAELVERITTHFAHDHDLAVPEAPPEPPIEPKVLPRFQFDPLFSRYSGHELAELLRELESSRLTGTKEQKLELLWSSRCCEETLLARTPSRTLERLLEALGLRMSGPKAERIRRLMDWARGVSEATVQPASAPELDEEPVYISYTRPPLPLDDTQQNAVEAINGDPNI